jgi:hypothetical protein
VTYVSRDPFARTELHRERENTGETCAWCGQVKRGKYLYRYRVETDGGRKFEDTKLFCSVQCRRDYFR